MKTSSEASNSADWTKKERDAREDERILEEVWDAMSLFGSFFGTATFGTFSKTDWKVMDQCKEKKGKGNQKWRLARISTAVQACVFPGLLNSAALMQPKVIYAVRRKFLASKPWVFSSCWSISGATPFG